jgi:hypothetical protein
MQKFRSGGKYSHGLFVIQKMPGVITAAPSCHLLLLELAFLHERITKNRIREFFKDG